MARTPAEVWRMVGMSKTDVRIDLNDEKRQESSKARAFHGSTASAGRALAWGLVGPQPLGRRRRWNRSHYG